jgi:chromosome segregation ATPase
MIDGVRPKVELNFDRALKAAQARLALLIEQLTQYQRQSKAVKANLRTERRVMEALDEELRTLQQQHRQQHTAVAALEAEDERIDAELLKLKGVVDPLVTEVTKLKLLVEGAQLPG